MQFHIPDPRAFAVYADTPSNSLIDLSLATLAAEVSVIAEKNETQLRERMVALVIANDTSEIADAMQRAPSLAVLRMLARVLAQAHVEAGQRGGHTALPTTVFALPIIVVAANASPVNVPGALPNIDEFVALMKSGGALRGNQTFVMSNALTSGASFALSKLPQTLPWWQTETQSAIAMEKASMQLPANQESVFLRFLVGTALAGPGVDLLIEKDTGKWGMPFIQAFAKQLGGGTLSLLAMPRPPRTPLSALYQGLAAQREVSFQLFATNAIRKFRSSVGEPEAVISAHRTDRGGEIRLSLSNALDEKGAEGFRAELHATDRAQDVAMMMQNLLAECNVASVTTLADVFPDVDSATNLPILFRADALETEVERALRLN
jgi:hypothetical protein